MGLHSAMMTALTGLSAAEAQIDVAGNNLANSQTVGFKASDVIFATQFLQTLSEGSGPTEGNGGSNPKQVGLGVQVAGITPDFSQGTIEISSSNSDMAIQGDGFFIVEGDSGEPVYTRTGIFTTNSANELVTATGNRLMGYGVDEFYELQQTRLVPLSIPLGSSASAQATQNVYLSGNLTPSGDLATAAEVIESDVLGDGQIPRPDTNDPTNPTSADSAPLPNASGITSSQAAAGTTFLAGQQYEYLFTFTDGAGQESLPSPTAVSATIATNGNAVTLSALPSSPLDGSGVPQYSDVNVYRRRLDVPAGDPTGEFRLIDTQPEGSGPFVDTDLAAGSTLDDTSLDGTYSYVITFSGSGVPESRPSEVIGPLSVVAGRVRLELPTIPALPAFAGYDTVNIYRNLSTGADEYYRVGSVTPGGTYTDARPDIDISDLTIPGNERLDMDGPKVTNATLLTDVVRRSGLDYESVFEVGELVYSARKGDNTLDAKTFAVTDETTVGQFLQFLTAASGIRTASLGDPDSVPVSDNNIPGESGTLAPGATVTSDGRLRIVSNNGTANAVEITASAFELAADSGTISSPNLWFSSIQDAVGESAKSDFVVYDSLGTPLTVRLTTTLESRDGSSTTYRWYADSGDNDPSGSDYAIGVGTGLISFDGDGKLIDTNSAMVSIDRADIPSATPLLFELDFSTVTGFASDTASISAVRQDGSSASTLTSYAVGEDGSIVGVFNNGNTRTLGQIRLARFSNPTGLVQQGLNMYGVGFNSGLPLEGNPGDSGLGSIVAGALELSNADVGAGLVDLMLASTQYRANSRVISTSQQLLDELMNIRR